MQKLTFLLATKEGDEIRNIHIWMYCGRSDWWTCGSKVFNRVYALHQPLRQPWLDGRDCAPVSRLAIWHQLRHGEKRSSRWVRCGSILQENVPIIKGMILHMWLNTRLWDFVCIRTTRMLSKSGLQSNETQPQTIANTRPEVNDGTTHWMRYRLPRWRRTLYPKVFSHLEHKLVSHCTLYQCLNLRCNVCYAQVSRVCNVYSKLDLYWLFEFV